MTRDHVKWREMTWNDAKLVKVQETNVFPWISYGSIYSDEGRCLLCEEEAYLVERDMIVFPRLSSAFGSLKLDLDKFRHCCRANWKTGRLHCCHLWNQWLTVKCVLVVDARQKTHRKQQMILKRRPTQISRIPSFCVPQTSVFVSRYQTKRKPPLATHPDGENLIWLWNSYQNFFPDAGTKRKVSHL